MTLSTALTGRVLLFAVATLTVTSLLSGLLPALAARRVDPIADLKPRGAGRSGGSRLTVSGHGLIALQVALSVVLLTVAGLLLHSLVKLTTHPVGFDPDRVAVVALAQRESSVSPAPMGDVVARLVKRLEQLPGVASVSQGAITPVSGVEIGINVRADGAAPAAESHAFFTSVAPRYFDTLGIPLLAGRDFAAGDITDRPTVAAINDTLARRLFGGTNPIGRSMRFVEGNRPPLEIVGVVADATYASIREPRRAFVYLPWQTAGNRLTRATLFVRSERGDAISLAGTMEQVFRSLDQRVTVTGVRTLRSTLDDSLHGDRVVSGLASAFGLLALGIAAVGLFGVLSVTVAKQTAEISLRMALGASPPQIVGVVARPIVVVVALGMGIGLAAARGATPALGSLLFEVEPADPAAMAAALALLVLTAVAAVLLPIRRAMRVAPSAALRAE
jgi:predicted permease